MNLETLFKLGVSVGIENDPRGKEAVDRTLDLSKKTYDALNEKEKEYFDPVSLWNPYPDSRIQAGDLNKDVKHIYVGIDIGVGDLVLVDRLIQKGMEIDAVMSHHPGGMGIIGLPGVMSIQADLMALHGVPINIAESIVTTRQKEVDQNVFAANHFHTADAAKLLGISLFSLHTPADNCVTSFLTKLVAEKEPETLDDLVEVMLSVPEYDFTKRRGLPPKIENGSGKNRLGKVVIEMTGGTTGSKDAYEHMSKSGVGTLVVMHIPKDHVEQCQKFHINVLNVGHMASDSIGMNILLDRFETNGVKFTNGSGMVRISRNQTDPYGSLRCPMPSSYLR